VPDDGGRRGGPHGAATARPRRLSGRPEVTVHGTWTAGSTGPTPDAWWSWASAWRCSLGAGPCTAPGRPGAPTTYSGSWRGGGGSAS
jgi:hypothetical protein